MNIKKVLTDNELSNSEKIVLMYLYEINKGNSVTLSGSYVSKQIGITRVTFIKAVKGLIEKGLIEKVSNFNMYEANMPNTYNLKTKKYM